MKFSLPIPEDLKALSAEEFAAFRTAVTAHAVAVNGDDSADFASMSEAAALAKSVTAEDKRRTDEAAEFAANRAELTAFTTAPVEVAPVVEPAPVLEVTPPTPAPVAVAPAAVVAAVRTSTIEEPVNVPEQRFATLVASSDVANAGAEISSFGEAAGMVAKRLWSYSSSTKSGKNTPVAKNRFKMNGRTFNRHGIVSIKREFPDDLRITEPGSAARVIEYARNQTRLPGGSLFESMAQKIKAGQALTAAAGWCAPSENIYDLCSLATLDGMLDLPEVQASRGGFNIPENGGPDFSTIWDSIGDDGDVILSEYDVENGVDKVCIEIPCPDFVEVRLDVAYLCITGALLQRRGYPEAVEQFSSQAIVALAHKVNQSVISRIETQSDAGGTIAAVTANTDGASQILYAVELAAIDLRYRHRMSTTADLELVLPVWALGPIRAAISRRNGVAELAVTDAEILAWFRVRNIAPHFVYDWQDAFSGQSGGPGGATPLIVYPANVRFLLYPAGTWVKPVNDVVNLDTVYDNALLTQNQFTALFVEDGFNVMQMCAQSLVYTTPLSPIGVTGLIS